MAAAALITVAPTPVAAQWIGYPPKGLPLTRDGKPDLSAPTPRTTDGKPDLSGVWLATTDPKDPAGGIEGVVAPKYQVNALRDFNPGDVPYQPWAEELFKKRQANFMRDNPMIRCLPAGVSRMHSYTHPYKIVQTRDLIVLLYESQTMFRQIFLDGRSHPQDSQPTWLGYSIGQWDGDTLVVETIGFNGETWLDGLGHPHSPGMRLVERFRRRDVGHMDVEITIDDPKAYTRPITYTQSQGLQTDADLIEYICTENMKPLGAGR
jgi:hypothetical protein